MLLHCCYSWEEMIRKEVSKWIARSGIMPMYAVRTMNGKQVWFRASGRWRERRLHRLMRSVRSLLRRKW